MHKSATGSSFSAGSGAAAGRATDFEYDGARYRDFRLVYPQCANITDGSISVLTPVGAALIGLSKGQSMWWPGSARRIHRLTVLDVKAGGATAGATPASRETLSSR